MEYFKRFPIITYDNQQVQNIFVRTKIKEYIKNNIDLYFDYVIKDGERPDIISEMFYGESRYAWLILLVNDIFDVSFDWPLTNIEFYKYIEHKYDDGTTPGIEIAGTTIYQYLNEAGFVVDKTTWEQLTEPVGVKTTVSCLDYEQDLNELKRNIRIIDKSYLSQIAQEYNSILKASATDIYLSRV